MAKQRFNTGIDALSYETSGLPYVAPPTKEILGLLDDRKEQYIKTKNQLNLNEEIAKTLKYNPISKDIYDEAIANMETAAYSITPENYADKELDTLQIANDFKNKWGGRELEQQQSQFAAAQAEIDKAEGVREAKKQWYNTRLARQLQPITRDDSGAFVVPSVSTPNVIKDIDLFDKADKLLTGWKASSKYVRNSDGSLSIDPGVIGQLGITKTDFADEKELYDTVVNYLGNDPINREYLEDEAAMALYDTQITPEYLQATLPTNVLKSYFPNKDPKTITALDIQNLTGGNQEMMADLAKHSVISNQMNQVGSALAAKHGFQEESKQFFTDQEYAESIKAKYAVTKGGGSAGTPNEAMGQLVIPMTTTTMQVGNPTIYDNYKAKEKEAIVNYGKKREEYLKLQAEFDTAEPDQQVLLKENVARAKEEVSIADQEIQIARQAQENLTKGTMKLAYDKGINIDKAYNDNATNISGHNSAANRKIVQKYGFSADITNLITNKNNKEVTVNLKGKNYILPIVSADNISMGKHYTPEKYVIKEGNTYKVYQKSTHKDFIASYSKNTNVFSDRIIDAIGFNKLQDNPYNDDGIKDNNSSFKSNIVPKTTKSDFKAMVSQLFMNPDTKFPGVPTETVKLAKIEADKIKEAKGNPSDVTVNQTLDYLYVPSDVKKGTAAKRLYDLGKVIDKTIESEGAQYKVRNNNGDWETLPLYLKSLGLEYTNEYIDFSKVRSGIMLTSDRKYGQQYNLPLPLTDKGKEALRETGNEPFALSGTLNLTAVNSNGRNNPFTKNVTDAVYKAYVESYGNTLPSGEEAKKAFGVITFDNSEYAQDFYDLNLYTLGHGSSVPYTLPDGNNINITAVKRSAAPDKLGDNDFFISNPQGDIFAYDVKLGKDRMVSKKEYEADTTASLYRRKLFASPEDIGGLIGTSLLDRRAIYNNNSATQVQQVKTTGSSYTIKPDSVISNEHRTNVNAARKEYGQSARLRPMKTSTGKEVHVQSKIDPNKLTYIKEEYPNSIKPNVYPYINNANINSFRKIMQDYNLYITDAFSPAGRENRVKEGAKGSLHEYGKSIDSRYNEEAQRLLTNLTANPQMAKDLGISYAFKHTVDGVPHLHIDFE